MPIDVRCPKCRKGYRLPEKAAGRRLPCKACGAAIAVPKPAGDDDDFLDDLDDLDAGEPIGREELAAPAPRSRGGGPPKSDKARQGKSGGKSGGKAGGKRAGKSSKSSGGGTLRAVLIGAVGVLVLGGACLVKVLPTALRAAGDAVVLTSDPSTWEPVAFTGDPAIKVSFPKTPEDQTISSNGQTLHTKAFETSGLGFIAWSEPNQMPELNAETSAQFATAANLIVVGLGQAWANNEGRVVEAGDVFQYQAGLRRVRRRGRQNRRSPGDEHLQPVREHARSFAHARRRCPPGSASGRRQVLQHVDAPAAITRRRGIATSGEHRTARVRECLCVCVDSRVYVRLVLA